jgi:hypothetical protein
MVYADCGMINEPGYVYSMDCSICECVKTPVGSSSSSSRPCHFIECGGLDGVAGAYADCGMINEPGYTYSLDCSICDCVKNPVSSSSSSS